MTKVGLIHLPSRISVFKRWEFEPPLWALTLATYLKESLPNVQVEIIDNQLSSLENTFLKIKEKKFDIVGLSPVTGFYNYKNVLEAARFAKKNGSRVVLGGHHASPLRREVLQNRGPYSKDYCVDAVIQYDGEKAFFEYVAGKPLDKINNLVYQERNGRVRENPIEILDLDEVPSTNYGLVNLESYFNYQVGKKRRLSFVFHRGCDWREKTGGCLFCAIACKKLKLKSPSKIWGEIKNLVDNYGVKEIRDAGDDLLASEDWVKELCKTSLILKNKPYLRIYSRACHINEKNTSLLKIINVKIVYLGIESFDENILRGLRKGVTVEANKKAISFLFKSNIIPGISLIFGSPGESKKSIENTLNEIKRLPPEILSELVVYPFYILPGSPAWDLFLKKEKKYIGQDLLSPAISKEWCEHFCKVSFEEILEALRQINEPCLSKIK